MWSRHCTRAFKRYQQRVIASALVYAVALCAAVWLFKHHVPAGALRYAVAVAPALPIVGIVASMGLFLKEEDDEFQRTLMIEQVLWGTGGALVLASIWGFLENFGLVDHLEAYWGVVVWFAMFGLARAVVRWRYR
jgi:hypothetical protein